MKAGLHMLTPELNQHAIPQHPMPLATPGDTASASINVTTNTIDHYADLVGDHNPIHLDDDYASETMFGGRVAHGMLSAGVVSAALASLPGDIIYLDQELSFTRPVRPGDTVTATVEVLDELGDDRIRVETIAETHGETVLEGAATVLSVPHGRE